MVEVFGISKLTVNVVRQQYCCIYSMYYRDTSTHPKVANHTSVKESMSVFPKIGSLSVYLRSKYFGLANFFLSFMSSNL